MLSRIGILILISAGAVMMLAGPLAAQYTISGTVRDPANTPVANVDVLLYTEQGDPIGGINPGLTNASGFYTLGSGGQIPSGTYNVGFEPPSSTDLLPKMVTGVVVAGNTTLNTTLELGNHVTGFVHDTTGTGIPDIDMNAYYESNGQSITLMNDNTGPNGSYDLLLPASLLRLVYRPVSGENLVPVELRNVNITGDTTINVTLRAGFVISGTVTGPGGAPVINADIDVEDSFTGLKLYTPGDNTGNNGGYEIRIPSGTFNISVQADPVDHLVPAIYYNVVIVGNTVIDFALTAGYILSGTVRDQSAAPVANADIDVKITATGVHIFTPSDNTDSTGIYRVVIPAGTYDIDYRPEVIPPYLASVRQRNIAMTTDRILNVTVPSGSLVSGQVRSFRGPGIPNINIDAKDSLGLDVPMIGDYTLANGNFAVILAPARYNVEIKPSLYAGYPSVMFENMRVRIDTSITVVLDTGLAVWGVVRDSTDAPFGDVKAIARRSDNGAAMFTPGNGSDGSGYYRIVVPPNTYDLTYKPDPASGVTDSVVLPDVPVTSDMMIDINFHSHSGDTEPPNVTVIAPNGGEQLTAYNLVNITWNATDNVGVTGVDIYYSTSGPNGQFAVIALDGPNDGVHPWSVPPVPTTDGRIKIVARDAQYNASQDMSDNSFSIIHSNLCCGGLRGDVNGNGYANGIDAVYFIAYLRGGTPPRDTCQCSDQGPVMALADVNGNCQVNGIDVTYMVSYFKGGAGLRCCPACPQVILRDESEDRGAP